MEIKNEKYVNDKSLNQSEKLSLITTSDSEESLSYMQ